MHILWAERISHNSCFTHKIANYWIWIDIETASGICFMFLSFVHELNQIYKNPFTSRPKCMPGSRHSGVTIVSPTEISVMYGSERVNFYMSASTGWTRGEWILDAGQERSRCWQLILGCTCIQAALDRRPVLTLVSFIKLYSTWSATCICIITSHLGTSRISSAPYFYLWFINGSSAL